MSKASPLPNYPGGKGSCFRHIVNLMPPHDVYIETHLGGGNVLLRKKPAARNIGIDVDRSVIAAWSDRIPSLPFAMELYNADAVSWLQSFTAAADDVDVGRVLIYADPPYFFENNPDLSYYDKGCSVHEHRALLKLLVQLPFFVILSGYKSALYSDFLQRRSSWRCIEFPNTTHGGRKIEIAWFNFDPAMLYQRHDCRYVGDNYRERERIKRKRIRWRKRLAAMSAGERQVILESLLELEPPKTAVRTGEGKNDLAGSRRTNAPDPTRYPNTPLFDDIESSRLPVSPASPSLDLSPSTAMRSPGILPSPLAVGSRKATA